MQYAHKEARVPRLPEPVECAIQSKNDWYDGFFCMSQVLDGIQTLLVYALPLHPPSTKYRVIASRNTATINETPSK